MPGPVEIGTYAGSAAPGEYSPGALLTTAGGIIIADATGKPVQLSPGARGATLVLDSTPKPSWLARPAAGLFLGSDGTDILGRYPPGYTALVDLGASAGVANATTGVAGTETTLLSGASGNVIAAAVAVGDIWDVEFSGNLLNNTSTASLVAAINIYFGSSYVVDTATMTTGATSATARSWKYRLRVMVETLDTGANTATLRVSGERYGIDNLTGVGTGWRTGGSNTWSFRAAESTGTNANLRLNAAQAFDVKAIMNSTAVAISGTVANLKMTLTECVVHYYPKNR